MRRFFGVFVGFWILLFVAGIAYNIYIFSDCINSGKRAYQCNAAMQNPHYIGVEDLNE